MATTMRTRETTGYQGPAWYQERYFRATLQGAIEAARTTGEELSLIIVSLSDSSRRSARAMFEVSAELEDECFAGLLDNGDSAICLPGYGDAAAARLEREMTRRLEAFGPLTGFAVMGREDGAEDLIAAAQPERLPLTAYEAAWPGRG